MNPEQSERPSLDNEQSGTMRQSTPTSNQPATPLFPPIANGLQAAGQPLSQSQPPSLPMGMGQSPKTPKKDRRKAVIFGTSLVIGLIIVAGFFLWYHENHIVPAKPSANTPRKPTSVSASNANAPHVTVGVGTTLGLGAFTVGAGKDVVPGLYSISPGSQQSGNFSLTSQSGNFSVILDNIAADPYGTSTAWIFLAAGDTFQISGNRLKTVTFTPVPIASTDPPILAKLYNATFYVTASDPRKVDPGKRLVHSAPNETGSILIISKDYKIKYSQTVNSTGFVADLVEGDRVAEANLSQVIFGPIQH